MEKAKKVTLLGIKIDVLNVDRLHAMILGFIQNKQHALVLHVNAHAMNIAHQEKWLFDYFNQANIVFCDGAGVRLGGKILGIDIPPRITYADWMWQIAEFSQQQGLSFFFLGAGPLIAQKAAEKLQERFPDLVIKGVHHGHFDKHLTSAENSAVIQKINQAKPDILLVGFGMPLQENWLRENWDNIDAHVALTGGAVFDYISGELKRAPKWMTDYGLEWLGRLIIEPKRLWKRYVVGNTMFLSRIMRQKLGF